jgi:gliding motility-associated-like protein
MKTLKSHLSLPISKSSNRPIVQSPNRPISQSSNLPIIALFLLLASSLFAQNEANIWYFGHKSGLDFNSGIPEVLYDGQIIGGITSATISDSSGQFLFCCEWGTVYSKHGIMENGFDLYDPYISGYSIVKWPGQDGMYYIITASYAMGPHAGLSYSIVDMKQNNGWGEVTEKNIRVESGWDVSDRMALVQQENSNSVWVVVRKNVDDAYASYLVDENGLHPDPVLSPAPPGIPEPYWEGAWGYMKISSDKKYLVSSYNTLAYGTEVCRFNAFTGQVEYMYRLVGPVNGVFLVCVGIEFSPDAKFLYVCNMDMNNSDEIYQYDLQYIADSAMFNASGLLIGPTHAFGLQLARDGKIYCTPNYTLPDIYSYYATVIHNPWIRGAGCNLEDDAINMFPNYIRAYNFGNILVDYLFRFEWTGEPCQGYPIHFKPNFIPTPDSIVWHFGEMAPGSMTTELSPTYVFQYPGVHEVQADVWYPSGRYEHTSREIEILPSPQPDLGPDTLICDGSSLMLNANCDADFFYWSTGQFGVSSITVSNSGTYWVRCKFSESGCEGYDTIHVGFHPPTIIDETNLIITPTTCNGASGSITGLYALGTTPFAYQWLDLSGNNYGANIDATGLPAGQYQLTITDGNGCETVSDVYTIEDAGNLQVPNVELTQPHCGRPDGQIVVHAFSPSGSVLQYSINDGATYQADSVFSGLIGTSYVVRVLDGNGCFGFYIDNPVVLADIPGPQVTQVNVTNETDFLENGAIEIVANGSTPVIYYSIDGGATYHSNNGTFNNVVCGMYYVVIKDEKGCDTSFTVEVQNVILTYLHAIIGEGGHCLGNTAIVPVNVDNFNSVASFHLKLSYNADNLQCEGFANVHPQLADSLIGWVDQGAGEINMAWKSTPPVTFSTPEKVADLVFTTKNPGQGQLSWYTGTTESYFTNTAGNPIPAQFQTGEVKIYEPPEIILEQSKTVCEGQFVNIMSIALGNQPPLNYRWIYPTGDTTTNDPLFFSITTADAGLYTLLATDRVGCRDQKSIELIVSENPMAAFHGIDTLEMHAGDILDAGPGMESLEWSTGDTTQSIVIQAEGMYSVGMESLFGCLGTDSIYIKLTSDEIPSNYIFIPNAFSPDGDGLNDTFMAIATSDYIQKFHMLIFDRWGGEIFESNDIFSGWDGTMHGKLLPGGMYTYKITYSIYPSFGDYSEQVRLGTVMMVR